MGSNQQSMGLHDSAAKIADSTKGEQEAKSRRKKKAKEKKNHANSQLTEMATDGEQRVERGNAEEKRTKKKRRRAAEGSDVPTDSGIADGARRIMRAGGRTAGSAGDSAPGRTGGEARTSYYYGHDGLLGGATGTRSECTGLRVRYRRFGRARSAARLYRIVSHRVASCRVVRSGGRSAGEGKGEAQGEVKAASCGRGEQAAVRG
jgi:hypothetical protein